MTRSKLTRETSADSQKPYNFLAYSSAYLASYFSLAFDFVIMLLALKMTKLQETIALDESANVRKTSDGFLVAEPRVARSGVQLYQGWEVGRPDMATVRVMRPESVVFDRASLQSYAHRPITNGHPSEAVSAQNWRDHSVGHVGGEVMRDGDFVRVPIVLMDAQTIDEVESGEVKQLSLGYQMALDWAGGDGYDASVTSIVANHLAVVPTARGGPSLNIGDDDMTGNNVQRLTAFAVDGISIEVPDAAVPILQRYQKDVDQKLTDAATQHTKLQTSKDELEEKIKTQDAEIATLKTQLEEAKVSDAKLDELVADRQRVLAAAKTVLGTDNLEGSTSELRKQVVLKRVGDIAKDWDDKQIAASFNTLNIQASDEDKTQTRNVISFDVAQNAGDAKSKALKEYNAYIADAWKNPKSVEKGA